MAFERSSIRIAVVPADHAFEPHAPSAWRLTNAQESWAWNGCEGRETRVEIYARGAEAALFLNGKQMGRRRLDGNGTCAFRVAWAPGELSAVSYGADGSELARTSLHSAGEATVLTLLPEQARVAPDALCYIRLRYADGAGMRKPLARGDIKVCVRGGTLLGLGSACPYNERGFLTDVTDTYYGEALAIVKPDRPGTVTLCAESPFGSAATEILCVDKGGAEG